ncbi:MAG TPA: AraC family transcriptional regulator [Lachnospiraceae bacterium]|nr:AraC family transcriptional regulator [Lachnospiraceae bacterium]
MLPLYENTEYDLEIMRMKFSHFPPHLHKALECVFVEEGTLEIGVSQELYHMEKGDFALVFPGMIHHYQTFGPSASRGIFVLAAPTLLGGFSQKMSGFCPDPPVISSENVHPDIRYALKALAGLKKDEESAAKPQTAAFRQKALAGLKKDEESAAKSNMTVLRPESVFGLKEGEGMLPLRQAYVQIILARSLPCLHLTERTAYEGHDLIYQTVAYVAGHYREQVSLTGMAKELGCSPYVLSRVFSGTFHMNFNQYVNKVRLEYAVGLLMNTDDSVTEVYLDAGFDSQRTFNRVFRESFHMSPREYRKSKNAL